MTLQEITEQLTKTAGHAPSMGKSVKFAFDEGVVHIDLTGEKAVISNDDKDADCVIITSIDNRWLCHNYPLIKVYCFRRADY